jgi:hypothetical protein
MIEVYVENNKVDISNEISTLLTFAIDDIKDFASRNTNFSKTIVLPGTAKNNALLGHLFDINIGNFTNAGTNLGINFNAARVSKCVILQNHIQIFKGVFRVLEVIIDNGVVEYEAAVFGELGGLVSGIGADKLEDLDFSAYNKAWSIANIGASWTQTQGSNVAFPLIDYGLVSTNKIDYDIRAFRPALYVKEYIDKIIAKAGYTYTSSFFDTAFFKSLIVPNNWDRMQSLTKFAAARRSFQTTSNVIFFDNPTDVPVSPLPGGNFYSTFFVADGTGWKYTDTTTRSFSLKVKVSGITNVSGGNISIAVRSVKNGATIFASQSLTGLTNGIFDIEYDGVVSLAQNDIVTHRIELIGGSYSAYNVDTTNVEVEMSYTTAIWQNTLLDEVLNINDSIPRNVLQKDFLASVIKMFNLYVVEDTQKSNHLVITPYPDFNSGEVIDWSGKLDRHKPMRIKPMSENNSRFYNFTYKPDVDNYNEQYRLKYGQEYGSFIFDSGFEFSKDRSDIEVVFSPTPLVQYAGTDKVISAIYKIENGVEKPTSSNIRILQYRNITGRANWRLKDGVTFLGGNLNNYGYAGHLDNPFDVSIDVNFGVTREVFFTFTTGVLNVNLFNVYWSSYMAEITDKDSKLLTADFYLTDEDINKLSFVPFIYVDGSLFRINKIMDYNASDQVTTKVELLKVINTKY